ncbi:MAG: MFS transporter [Planctomycetota bacterium]|nr:MFS transporter [Planctomycetota bacterium]MEE3365270.1 MFS transporter [Planctomycetota bacterium]
MTDLSPPPADSAPPVPRRASLGVLFLTVFVDLVGFSIIFPLFPDMLDHYVQADGPDSLIGSLAAWLGEFTSHPDPDKQRLYTTALFGGVLGSIYSALQFVFAPFWGRLSDRTGRRPILLISITGLALAYLVWVFAGSFVLLVISRVVAGIMGGNISVATAAVADITGEKDRAKGMGMIGAAFGLGFILGPAIGGLLSSVDLSDSGIAGLNPFSAPALAAMGLSIWNLTWVSLRFPETLPSENRGTSPSHARSFNPVRLLSGHNLPNGVSGTNLLFFLYQTAFAGMEFTLVFLAKERLEYTRHEMMWIFIFVGLLIALVQGGIVRRLAPKLGERRLVRTGLFMLVPGLVIVGSTPEHDSLHLYGGLALLAIGSALVSPCLSALVSLYTPADRQGEVLGVFRSIGALSRAIAPVIAGLVFWKLGSQWPYYGSALIMIAPLLLSSRLPAPAASDATPTSAGE